MVFVRLRTLVIGLVVAAFAGTALNAAIPPAGTYGFFFEGDRTYGGGATGTLTITSSGAFTGQTRPLLPLYVLPTGPIQFIYKPFTGFRGEFDESGTARVLLPRPKVPPRYIYPQTSLILRYVEGAKPRIEGSQEGLEYYGWAGTAYPSVPAGTVAGTYTAALVSVNPPTKTLGPPGGDGWVTWRVQPSGSVRISGRTAAGATISHGGFLRAGRSFWFGRYVDFQKLYDGRNRSYPLRIIDEYLDGEVSLGSGPVQETTTLRWDLSNEGGGFNAPNNGFRWSFRTKVTMQPSRFSLSKPLFAFPTSNGGRLRVTVNSVDREQPPTVAFAELARRFGELRVVSVTPPLQTLRFTRGSSTSDEPLLGAFRGTLQFPGDSIARKFSGVVLQDENIGRGYYEASEVFRLNTGQIRIEVDNDPP